MAQGKYEATNCNLEEIVAQNGTVPANLRIVFVLFTVSALNVVALASGPPCWDNVPPTDEYAQRHVVNGSGSQLSADGLIVYTKKSETGRAIIIELSVTNCSANAV